MKPRESQAAELLGARWGFGLSVISFVFSIVSLNLAITGRR